MSTGQGETAQAVRVPAGAPEWVTAELIADTVETWQPYYAADLTDDKSVAILQSVARLAQLLSVDSKGGYGDG